MREFNRTIPVVFLISIFLVTISCKNAEKQKSDLHQVEPTGKTGLNIGDTAPTFSHTDISGDTIALEDFKNDVVLLYFWASWCPNCKKINPHLADLYRNYKDKTFPSGGKFEIISISLDDNDDAWRKIASAKLPWKMHVSDQHDAIAVTAAMYQVMAIPHSLLLAPGNVIVAKNEKPAELAEILQQMR